MVVFLQISTYLSFLSLFDGILQTLLHSILSFLEVARLGRTIICVAHRRVKKE
jgi:hypothetical protein